MLWHYIHRKHFCMRLRSCDFAESLNKCKILERACKPRMPRIPDGVSQEGLFGRNLLFATEYASYTSLSFIMTDMMFGIFLSFLRSRASCRCTNSFKKAY